jgi:hypothetical protein
MTIRVAALALGLVVCAVCGLSAAQDSDTERAQAAFQKGKQAYQNGDYGEAAAAFRQAYEIKPTWKVLYNIAQCEALAKRHGLAFEAFQKYLSQGGDDISTERRDEVLAEIDRLQRMVGSVEVVAPDGATVGIDGFDRGETPLPGRLKVAAGVKHQVRVELAGEVLVERSVLVSSGETIKVEVSDQSDMSDGSDEESDVSDGSDEESDVSDGSDLSSDVSDTSPVSTWGWVTLGLGGALLVGGGVTGGMAMSLDDELSEPCGDGGCPPSKHEDLDKRDALAITTNVLLAVGGTAVVAGVLMLTVFDGDEDEVDVGLAPAAGSGFAGVTVTGRF